MLALDVAGSGDPLVLVHGLGTTRVVWRLVAPALARDRRVVAVDVPGFGESPPAGRGFDLQEVAARIARELARAGVDAPYDLLGHSMGGALALTLAVAEPAAVRRLVLSAPAGLTPTPQLAARLLGVAGGPLLGLRRFAAPLAELRLGRRVLLAGGTLDGGAIAPSQARAMLAASAGSTRVGPALTTVASADLRPLLDRLDAPVAAVWGRQDRVVPHASIEAIRERRPELVVATVENAGHIAMVEKPAAYVRAVQDVLGRLPVR